MKWDTSPWRPSAVGSRELSYAGLTFPMRRWSRSAAASCACCQACSSCVLGKAMAAMRCNERRPEGPCQNAAEPCRRGRGGGYGMPTSPQPAFPVLHPPSGRAVPRSAPCGGGGDRGTAGAVGHTCRDGWGWRSESLFCLAQPTVGPPCSPIHSGCWGHHLLLDSLQLEAVVLRGARQVTTTWVTSA